MRGWLDGIVAEVVGRMSLEDQTELLRLLRVFNANVTTALSEFEEPELPEPDSSEPEREAKKPELSLLRSYLKPYTTGACCWSWSWSLRRPSPTSIYPA